MARLHAADIERYTALHDAIPPTNEDCMRRLGYTDVQIFRTGDDLVMIIEIDDRLQPDHRAGDEALTLAWEKLTQPCFARPWSDGELVYALSSTEGAS